MRKRGVMRAIHVVATSDRLSGLIMLAFACCGLVLANLPWTAQAFHDLSHTRVGIPYFNLDLPIASWAEDGLLTIFFLTVGLDLRQEMTTGSLSRPQAAAVPMLCAVGGMLVPPVLFIGVIKIYSLAGFMHIGVVELGGHAFATLAQGWAIPTATDIAFSLAILAIFARSLPGSIRAFLMTLAAVDDLLAIILIAVFFSSLSSWYWFIGIAICAIAWHYLLRLKKVPWLLVGCVGILAWFMMFQAGVHSTLAGVLVGLLTPSRELHGEKSPRAHRYHGKLQPLSALIALPVFALFATGVHFDHFGLELFISPVVVGICVALVVGKPLGIMLMAAVSTRSRYFMLPKGLKLRDLVPASCACGIGFTVSFLIATLAYTHEELSGEARFGVLLGSLMAAALSGVLLTRQSKRMVVHKVHHEGLMTSKIVVTSDGTQILRVPLFTPDQVRRIRGLERSTRQKTLSRSGRIRRHPSNSNIRAPWHIISAMMHGSSKKRKSQSRASLDQDKRDH